MFSVIAIYCSEHTCLLCIRNHFNSIAHETKEKSFPSILSVHRLESNACRWREVSSLRKILSIELFVRWKSDFSVRADRIRTKTKRKAKCVVVTLRGNGFSLSTGSASSIYQRTEHIAQRIKREANAECCQSPIHAGAHHLALHMTYILSVQCTMR